MKRFISESTDASSTLGKRSRRDFDLEERNLPSDQALWQKKVSAEDDQTLSGIK